MDKWDEIAEHHIRDWWNDNCRKNIADFRDSEKRGKLLDILKEDYADALRSAVREAYEKALDLAENGEYGTSPHEIVRDIRKLMDQQCPQPTNSGKTSPTTME